MPPLPKKNNKNKVKMKWSELLIYFSLLLHKFEMAGYKPFALRGHMWPHFYEMKVIWFFLRKKISGSYLKQNNSDLVFSNPHYFLKMSNFVAGHVTKIMNYPFLNTNFALTHQGKCWKDDVVTFTAHLSITIKCITIKCISSQISSVR